MPCVPPICSEGILKTGWHRIQNRRHRSSPSDMPSASCRPGRFVYTAINSAQPPRLRSGCQTKRCSSTYCAFSNYVQQLLHIQLEVGFWGRAEFLKQAVWQVNSPEIFAIARQLVRVQKSWRTSIAHATDLLHSGPPPRRPCLPRPVRSNRHLQ